MRVGPEADRCSLPILNTYADEDKVGLRILHLKDKPRQATELPWPIREGDIRGEPGDILPPSEFPEGFLTRVVEDLLGLRLDLPLEVG